MDGQYFEAELLDWETKCVGVIRRKRNIKMTPKIFVLSDFQFFTTKICLEVSLLKSQGEWISLYLSAASD